MLYRSLNKGRKILYRIKQQFSKSGFLTQHVGPLVGSIGERPVRSVVVASQFDMQLTSEWLILMSRKQPATLQGPEMWMSHPSTCYTRTPGKPGRKYTTQPILLVLLILCMKVLGY